MSSRRRSGDTRASSSSNPSWDGEEALQKALEGLACAKGTSANRVKNVASTALRYVKDYKRVVHDVESFLWKADVEHRLGGLYAVDAIIRQSQAKNGTKDPFVKRFGLHLTHTLNAVKKIPSEFQRNVRHVIEEWQSKGFYTSDEIEQAGGNEYSIRQKLRDTQQPKDNGLNPNVLAQARGPSPRHETTPKSSTEKLASLLSIIKKQKERKELGDGSGSPHSASASDPAAGPVRAPSPHEPVINQSASSSSVSAPSVQPQSSRDNNGGGRRRDDEDPRSRERGRGGSRWGPPKGPIRDKNNTNDRERGRDLVPEETRPAPINTSNEPRVPPRPSPGRRDGVQPDMSGLHPPHPHMGGAAPAAWEQPSPRQSYDRRPSQNSKSVCQEFMQFGNCRLGNRCELLHSTAFPADVQGPGAGQRRGPPAAGGGGPGPSYGSDRFTSPSDRDRRDRRDQLVMPPHDVRYGQPHLMTALPGEKTPGTSGEVCRKFLAGRCGFGDRCWHIHDGSNLKGSGPAAGPAGPSTPGGPARPRIEINEARRKTVLCANFPSGNCRFGDKCSFAHGEEDLDRGAMKALGVVNPVPFNMPGPQGAEFASSYPENGAPNGRPTPATSAVGQGPPNARWPPPSEDSAYANSAGNYYYGGHPDPAMGPGGYGAGYGAGGSGGYGNGSNGGMPAGQRVGGAPGERGGYGSSTGTSAPMASSYVTSGGVDSRPNGGLPGKPSDQGSYGVSGARSSDPQAGLMPTPAAGQLPTSVSSSSSSRPSREDPRQLKRPLEPQAGGSMAGAAVPDTTNSTQGGGGQVARRKRSEDEEEEDQAALFTLQYDDDDDDNDGGSPKRRRFSSTGSQ